MRLKEKVIIVTGAAAGLGEAMATGFVAEGATVICGDIDRKRLEKSIEKMDGPGEAIPIFVDVSDESSVDQMIRVSEELGGADILINNAGVKQLTLTGEEHQIIEMSTDLWDEIINTNLRGCFLCTKAVLPGMMERKRGRIIHVTSGHGKKGRVIRAAYVSSKFGCEGFHWTLSLELVDTPVESLVFTPPPGGVRTQEAAFVEDPLRDMNHDPEVIIEPMIKLAAGGGRNGGRYRGGSDGRSYEETDYIFNLK